MNFKKWYNTKGAGSHAGHTIAKEWGGQEAWDGCKKEVLKILQKSNIPCNWKQHDRLIDKIKNL